MLLEGWGCFWLRARTTPALHGHRLGEGMLIQASFGLVSWWGLAQELVRILSEPDHIVSARNTRGLTSSMHWDFLRSQSGPFVTGQKTAASLWPP